MKTFITFILVVLALIVGILCGKHDERVFQTSCADGTMAPGWSHDCIGHRAAVEPTPTLEDSSANDASVAADLKELDRRDHMIADRINQMQSEITQLHEDDKSTLSFIEELFKQFFGVEIQRGPDEPQVEPQSSPSPSPVQSNSL